LTASPSFTFEVLDLKFTPET